MTPLKTADLKRLLAGSGGTAPLINTLPPEHFAKTKIPNSVNIPLESSDFIQRVEALAGNKSRTVIVYCANEECDSSKRAAAVLEDAGFSNVFEYEGGAQAWEESGEPLGAGK
jgi:rhodanese-related sulfurtransferase